MKLAEALRLSQSSRLALVGAGGKTTALFQAARELPPPVLVTATTHLAEFQVGLADHHTVIENPEDFDPSKSELSGVVLFTGPQAGSGRVAGVSLEVLEAICQLADSRGLPLLVEADGSRQLPVKAPADHEPAIPPFADTVVVVAGLSALGKPLSPEWVHRPERFALLAEVKAGEEITSAALARLLLHPAGGLKNIPRAARRIALLNQADSPELQAQAQGIARLLIKDFPSPQSFHAVILASLQTGRVHAVYEPVAGIILAAGEASRYGEPKQLLPWHGKPLIRHISQTALDAGLTPVVVVSGAYPDLIREALHNMDVTIVKNAAWKEGQSSSVRAGLQAAPGVGAAVFLLSDQPLVPAGLIQAMVEAHATSLSPIVAPLVDGSRANPVLFDQVTFSKLKALSGDVGGRALFSKYPAQWVPWHDPSLLLDIDTPEDYRRLLDLES